MKFLKKTLVTLSLCATLFLSMPTPKAKAGILLLPAGVGIIVLIIGIVHNNLLLTILDENGDHSSTPLEQALKNKYPQIDDPEAIADLANLIKEKYNAIDKQSVQEGSKVEIKLSIEEVEHIMTPTGLKESNPEFYKQLITDLT